MTFRDTKLLREDWVGVSHADRVLHGVRASKVVLVVGKNVMVLEDEVLISLLEGGGVMRGRLH